MARNKNPLKLKLLTGQDKKNPQRVNKEEPVTAAIGEPPEHFRGKKRDIWEEIKMMVMDGVIQQSDAVALERIAVLLYKSRHQANRFTASDEAALAKYLSKFGMTPSDRQSIIVPGKSEGDFDGF